MPAIEIRQLTRVYGSRRGVQDVNLAIPAGSLYGFLGPNGAGKTTTIRVLLGFLRATTGSARVLGLDCWRESERVKAEVGAIPGDLRLWGWLTGESALKLFSRIRRRDLVQRGRWLAEVLELDLSVPVHKMSRGMRQKLGLILSMAHRPRVLILDEPTTALDPLMQDHLRRLLREEAQSGTTVFFSSHTLAEVEDLCERVAIVRQGKIIADDTLSALKAQAGHDVEVLWPAGVEPPDPSRAPAGLRLSLATREKWVGKFGGALPELLTFLAAHPVADLRLARPDLEALFMQYYRDEPE
jgi:ABC-2 type transport system ATP-binding protein